MLEGSSVQLLTSCSFEDGKHIENAAVVLSRLVWFTLAMTPPLRRQRQAFKSVRSHLDCGQGSIGDCNAWLAPSHTRLLPFVLQYKNNLHRPINSCKLEGRKSSHTHLGK